MNNPLDAEPVEPFENVLKIELDRFSDERGFFVETWRRDRYRQLGIEGDFVQDNLSRSQRSVLRGLHFQHPNAQGKLIWITRGKLFDVTVDVRLDSPTFGQWAGVTLSASEALQLWIPPGFAHGFAVLSEQVDYLYKCTAYYSPEAEHTLRWNDPEVGVDWPVTDPMLSDKDRNGRSLEELRRAEVLPTTDELR